jgi:Bacterial membrane protein YfhO
MGSLGTLIPERANGPDSSSRSQFRPSSTDLGSTDPGSTDPDGSRPHSPGQYGLGLSAQPWPQAVVGAVITWSLWELRATVRPAQFLNDSSVHEQMVRFAAARIGSGHDPLTSWFPYLGLGSPQFLHYQSLPAILTGLAGLAIGPEAAFRWSLYLLLCLWPIAIYGSARVFGLSRAASASAAVVAPLLHSVPGIGYEQHAYLWTGYGVWTQLWGSWALPFAWALTWRAMADKRFIAPAGGLVALTAAFHFETGYLAFAAIPVMPFLIRDGLAARLARAAGLLATALLAAGWVILPLLLYSRWAGINQALAGTPLTDGYGARQTLTWLATGDLLDDGHLPVITLLAAAGLITALVRCRTSGPERALIALLVTSLLLAFGRTTFGDLTAIIPGSADLFFRRFLMGAQLAAIYLAGLGTARIADQAARLAGSRARALTRRRPALGKPVPVLALAATAAAAGLSYLYPAWHYLATYDAATGNVITTQVYYQASRPQAAAVAAVRAAIGEHGPGRAFAGQMPAPGYPAIGLVPLYAYLESQDIDEVGYTLRTASLMTQPEDHFDPANPGDYPLFGVRYLVLPARPGLRPPPAAVLIYRDAGLRLYELSASSYFRVADTVGTISANRADIGSQTAPYLASAQPGRDEYLTVGYAADRPARPTLTNPNRAANPPGTVTAERADLADGTASAVVHLRRRAAVVLSVSFDPGWTATVDGRPAAIQMVAPALLAVTAPPGSHHVDFRYVGYGGYPELFALAVAGLLTAAALTRTRQKKGHDEVRVALSPTPSHETE